jgi:hypothetical protein
MSSGLLHQDFPVPHNKVKYLATPCFFKLLQQANERPSALHSVIDGLCFQNCLSQLNLAIFPHLLSCVLYEILQSEGNPSDIT